MKLESSLDRRPALLHLAPVLDVMALMVVFFLLGSSLIYQSGVGVELPVSPSQLPPLAASHVVLITASDPPMVFLNRAQMGYEALLAELEKGPTDSRTTVYFKLDRRLSSGLTLEAMNAALKGGYRVFQATDRKAQPSVSDPQAAAPAPEVTAP